jgi:hypothetical protein
VQTIIWGYANEKKPKLYLTPCGGGALHGLSWDLVGAKPWTSWLSKKKKKKKDFIEVLKVILNSKLVW